MTEDLENVIQELDPVANANELASEEPKKTFTSDVVKKVVEREKQKAFERGKREALMELQQQPEQSIEAAVPAQQPTQNVGLGGMKQLNEADIERMIAEKAPLALQSHVQKLQQDQMVNTFVNKMQLAEQQYPGLEAELNQLNYNDPRIHAFIEMANHLDNTGDIMKEVLDNPTKMESLLNMAYNQPYQAQKALKSLSDSIKVNQTAKAEEAQARDPLSQIKSSTTSGNVEKSQHDMSQEDLRRLLAKRFK
jgi:uncharacterized protein (UPF0335 family)